MYEYLVPAWEAGLKSSVDDNLAPLSAVPPQVIDIAGQSSIDRTAKLYIGGKQARPDSGYSYTIRERLAVRLSVRQAWVIARISAMQSRQRRKLPDGPRHQLTIVRRFSIISLRTCLPVRRNLQHA